MSKYIVLVIEDEATDAAFIQTSLAASGHEIAGVCSSIDEARQAYLDRRPDVCIVDIYLDGKPDGVTFARWLADNDEPAPVVFLTGHYDEITFYFARTTNPHHYLLKPFNPIELQYAIDLAVDKVKNAPLQQTDTLFVKLGTQMIRLAVRDIRYIEVDGKYSKIICNNEKFLVQLPLKELQSKLPASLFSRIHRNYLVNIELVKKIDTHHNEVIFTDGTSFQFSRRYLQQLMNAFKVFK